MSRVEITELTQADLLEAWSSCLGATHVVACGTLESAAAGHSD